MPNAAAPSGLSNQEQLADRFDGRAQRLRRQAHAFLWIIILVLIAGAIGFVFANRIATLDLKRHSAADQYAAALAAQKQINDQIEATQKRIGEIVNTAPIAKPFNDDLNSIKDEIVALEDKEVGSCRSITQTTKRSDINSAYNPSVRPTPERLGEYGISLPTRELYFSDQDAASDCSSKINARVQEFRTFFRRTQDIQRERDKKVSEFGESKQAEVAPLNIKMQEFQAESARMAPVIAETSKRAAEERILGAPLGVDTSVEPQDKTGATDWAQIISSNLTRLSSLGIMFFLVAVLVPQYRYNMRMAAFYDARADSIRLAGALPTITDINDLEKTILAMTPNIDFGKAPATPIDQLVELVRAARH